MRSRRVRITFHEPQLLSKRVFRMCLMMVVAYASSPFLTVTLPRCERSSNCPMCWQAIGLKDPASQKLLIAVERERCLRSSPSRNTAMHHHPTLRDFELQHISLKSEHFYNFFNIFCLLVFHGFPATAGTSGSE